MSVQRNINKPFSQKIVPMKKIKMKITVIGSSGSGKSSFIHNLIYNQFLPSSHPTYNYQISIYQLKNLSTQYQIQIWQCGSNHFLNNKFIRKAFFRNSSASFLIYDLCNPQWKQDVVKWIQQAYSNQSFLVYAVGTKGDLLEKFTMDQKLEFIRNGGGQINNQDMEIFRGQQKQHKNNKKSNHVSLYTQNSDIRFSFQHQNNQFFQLYQIKHFYQAANDKISYEIKNIFISINDDRHKLTRSSIVRATKIFQNSLIGQSGGKLNSKQKQRQKQRQKQYSKQKNRVSILMQDSNSSNKSNSNGYRYSKSLFMNSQKSKNIINDINMEKRSAQVYQEQMFDQNDEQ